MKAIVYTQFGSTDVLQLREVSKPDPRANEVLINIKATTVAAEDPDIRQSPGLNGFRRPRKPILGFYLAGVVEAVGREATRFKPGDKVYGNTGLKLLSTYAEYIAMPEDGALVPMPAGLSFEEAAAIPNGLLTALPFLRDKGGIRPGMKVLINGASGAVGTSAVQVARHFGAEVTAVCSSGSVELVKGLGADHVIDYTREAFTNSGETYDIIFDAVGKSSFAACRGALTETGVYLTTVPSPAFFVQALTARLTGRKRARFAATGMRSSRDKLADLQVANQLIEAGELTAVIDRRYWLDQMAEAHQYVELGHKKGNVVIAVA